MGGPLIQGRGAVSAYGIGCEALFQGVFGGARSLRPRERLRDVDCLTEFCAEVGHEICDGTSEAGLPLLFATLAAREALANTSPDSDTILILATTKAVMSGIQGLSQSPTLAPSELGYGQPARLAQALAEALDWRGPVQALSAACASGLTALAQAGRALAAGRAQRALVVGTDALSPFILRGFSALLALDPGMATPFDRRRRGLSLGEGAGAILLGPSANPPVSNEASIHLTGWGESNDANHITGPSRDGRGLARAIEKALGQAQLRPIDIDFIHLHGTGTPYNDAMEQRAIAQVFEQIPACSGSKAQLGHTLGAAGILESLITIEALQRATAPANVGYEIADEDAPFELSNQPIALPRAQQAIKIAAGFGGINAALTFRRRP